MDFMNEAGAVTVLHLDVVVLMKEKDPCVVPAQRRKLTMQISAMQLQKDEKKSDMATTSEEKTSPTKEVSKVPK